MKCNCQMTQAVIGIVILVFAFWSVSASQWIIALAAIALLAHAFMCKTCKMSADGGRVKRK